MNIIYLHHSTGSVIYNGVTPSLLMKVIGRITASSGVIPSARLPILFEEYNEEHATNYLINEMAFPKAEPYGWNNFPYDYYNIWVKNAGENPYMEEPTLEMLTKDYQVIIFKHCFPVCYIQADQEQPDINSSDKTISNYKLQYTALREKLHEFPDTKFILFTGAALEKSSLDEDKAIRAREFFDWVINEWDLSGDNIFLWDLYGLETEGELYLKDKYAAGPNNSHPNEFFASRAVGLIFNRIIDVIENDGNGTQLTGSFHNQ